MREYMFRGIKRDACLNIVGLTRHQFYYQQTGVHRGRQPSSTTRWRDPITGEQHEVDNAKVVEKIVSLKLDPDHSNWYRMLAVTLAIQGYYINHKKVYRLMQSYVLLEDPKRPRGRNFVKYRRVIPSGPLRIIEMDIKYIYLYHERRFAKVLTILDTFTRYVLHWTIGRSMRSSQVKQAFGQVIANYFQKAGLLNLQVEVVLRNDNEKVFAARQIQEFFERNHIRQEFTHPYTPEENGHIESFHSIISKALAREKFTSLEALEERLNRFYRCYNNDRAHGSTRGVPPAKFWVLHEMGKIRVNKLDEHRVRFELTIPYQDILMIENINKYEYRRLRA